MKLQRLLIVSVVVLAGLGCAGVALWQLRAAPAPAWRTAPLTRRDVQKIVSASGVLTADPSVEVGTQVSGIVAELLVDYNDKVAAGDVLARIDPTLLEADVAAAEARLAEADAQQEKAAAELHRMEGLAAREAATAVELEAAKAAAAVAKAQQTTARVAVAKARRNVGYATITAPVAGTIVKRNVNLGQTVNAGFSAPTLFTLAGDLAHMIILANVDESDVGLVVAGQAARFTVQTFPDRQFTGTVRKVRLDAKTDQGVVTYTTVVDVDNTDGALFPGMTATVEFVSAEATAVLCALNAALRFSPEDDVVQTGDVPAPEPATTRGNEGKDAHKRRSAPSSSGVVWSAEGGGVRAAAVTVGIRGADCAEVSGPGLTENMELVLGVDRSGVSETAKSPFGHGGGGPGKPGGF